VTAGDILITITIDPFPVLEIGDSVTIRAGKAADTVSSRVTTVNLWIAQVFRAPLVCEARRTKTKKTKDVAADEVPATEVKEDWILL